MLRLLRRLLSAALLLSLLAGVLYAFSEGARGRWRGFVMEQLAERGVHLEFARFGLHPIDGLVAREVRLFNDAEHRQLIMSIDRLNLDIDWGKLTENKIYIEGIDLANAAVKLPLDNDQPQLGSLDVMGMSAHVFLLDDRLEISKAEGDLAGILRVGITGSLLLPKKKAVNKNASKATAQSAQSPTTQAVAGLQRFDLMRAKSGQVKAALDWLQRFTFDGKPQLDLHLEGDVARLDELSASLHFSAGSVVHGSYRCDELSADAKYIAGYLDLKRLLLKDSIGTFEASAGWHTAGDEIDFQLTTTADLPSLAKSLFDSDALHEVVLYASSPPLLTLSGTWFVRGEKAKAPYPINATGRVQVGRFGTHGGIFEGAAASFGVSREGFYIRDAMLRHRSGSLTLQAMLHSEQGFKYRTALKMDPNALLPFITTTSTRDLIKRFEVTENSSVFVQVEGAGLTSEVSRCQNVGRFEFHDVSYRGTLFTSASADVSFSRGSTRLTNVQMKRPEGHVAAAEVHIDGEAHSIRLDGVKGRLDPVPVLGCFTRPVAESLVKYSFTPRTEIEVDGLIGLPGGPPSDYAVRFRAPEGTATYPLWGRNYLITAPVGHIDIKGAVLGYDITGTAFDGPMKATGSVHLGGLNKGDYTVELEAASFPYAVFGKDLPFEKVRASVRSIAGVTPFAIKARMLGGGCDFAGTVEATGSDAPYRGELRVDEVSFKRFAQTYSAGNESEGDLTGHFKFTGKLNDWKALKGEGVLIILNGNLYAIPVLGPLTPLLAAVLPKPIAGYNEANEANCTFHVNDGVITTDNFEALTAAFKIVANGTIDFLRDHIDFNAQARARGLPGLVLLPVSELFEYKGEGSVSRPEWRPRLFSIGSSRKDEEATMADKPTAQRQPEPKAEPVEDAPKPKPRDRPLISPLGRMIGR